MTSDRLVAALGRAVGAIWGGLPTAVPGPDGLGC